MLSSTLPWPSHGTKVTSHPPRDTCPCYLLLDTMEPIGTVLASVTSVGYIDQCEGISTTSRLPLPDLPFLSLLPNSRFPCLHQCLPPDCAGSFRPSRPESCPPSSLICTISKQSVSKSLSNSTGSPPGLIQEVLLDPWGTECPQLREILPFPNSRGSQHPTHVC